MKRTWPMQTIFLKLKFFSYFLSMTNLFAVVLQLWIQNGLRHICQVKDGSIEAETGNVAILLIRKKHTHM